MNKRLSHMTFEDFILYDEYYHSAEYKKRKIEQLEAEIFMYNVQSYYVKEIYDILTTFIHPNNN